MTSKDIIARAERNIREAREDPPPVSGDQYAAGIVNDLFKSLFAAKPGWRASFPNIKDQAELDSAVGLLKKTWIKAFAENGINTKEQIQAAMRKVRKDPNKFLPSVGEFMEWTSPDLVDFGLPDAEQAYLECCHNAHHPIQHKWSHPAIYQAGREAKWHSIRSAKGNSEVKSIKSKFMRAYERMCKAVMRGEHMNGPEVITNALEVHQNGQERTTESNDKVGNDTIKELKGLFK